MLRRSLWLACLCAAARAGHWPAPAPARLARLARRAREVRGGSNAVEPEADEEEAAAQDGGAVEARERRAWLLEQVRRRQERVLVLSKSLAERGLPFGDGSLAEPEVKGAVEAPDWVCALSTAECPKSCLIWGDAAEDTKVVRPRKAPDQWVSLSALNALRRTEPVKASRLWYDKYALDLRRFNDEAGPVGALLGAVLDSRKACRALAAAAAAVLGVIVQKPLAFLVIRLLTSQQCWSNYALWSPIVHAPLPLKLLIARQAYITAVTQFRVLQLQIRAVLIDVESRVLEAGVHAAVDDDAAEP